MDEQDQSVSLAAAAEDLLSVLAAPARVELLIALADGPVDVGALRDRCAISMSSASQHLRRLRGADLVACRARRQRRVYALTDAVGVGVEDGAVAVSIRTASAAVDMRFARRALPLPPEVRTRPVSPPRSGKAP